MTTLRCAECGHDFDIRDRRGYVPKDKPDDATCPACWLERHEGAPAWAISNDCQGVFACSVFHSKREAVEALAQFGWHDCRIVPVRVHAETVDGARFREFENAEWERNGLLHGDAAA